MLKTLAAASAVTLITAMSGPSTHMQAFPLPAAPDPLRIEGAPPQYWGEPGPFIIAFADPAVVDAYCTRGAPGPRGYVVLACTRDDVRQVAMPNPCLYQHEYYAKLLCHEQAHLSRPGLSGWRH